MDEQSYTASAKTDVALDVRYRVDTLRQEIAAVTNAVDELHKRLGPMLQPSLPSEAPDQMLHTVGESPLNEELANMTAELSAVTKELRNLLERLDI